MYGFFAVTATAAAGLYSLFFGSLAADVILRHVVLTVSDPYQMVIPALMLT